MILKGCTRHCPVTHQVYQIFICTVLPPKSNQPFNNNHPKCRQLAVFIWNSLYSEVFWYMERSIRFQTLCCYWEMVAIQSDVYEREHCILYFLLCKKNKQLINVPQRFKHPNVQVAFVFLNFKTNFLQYFELLNFLSVYRFGSRKKCPSLTMKQ